MLLKSIVLHNIVIYTKFLCNYGLYTFAWRQRPILFVFQTKIEVFSVLEPLRSTLTMLRQLQDLQKYNLRLSFKQFRQVSSMVSVLQAVPAG